MKKSYTRYTICCCIFCLVLGIVSFLITSNMRGIALAGIAVGLLISVYIVCPNVFFTQSKQVSDDQESKQSKGK